MHPDCMLLKSPSKRQKIRVEVALEVARLQLGCGAMDWLLVCHSDMDFTVSA